MNFVLTDPPYLCRYRSRDGRTVLNDDQDGWLRPAFSEIYRVMEDDSYCVTFYGWASVDRFVAAFRAAGFRLLGHLCFAKRYASTTGHMRAHHEAAFLLGKGYPRRPSQPISDVREWEYSGNKLHPTQKPVVVMRELVESFSRPGRLVLDPFAGSGSSLVAAQEAGRDYLGIELAPEYHRTMCERLGTVHRDDERRHHRSPDRRAFFRPRTLIPTAG